MAEVVEVAESRSWAYQELRKVTSPVLPAAGVGDGGEARRRRWRRWLGAGRGRVRSSGKSYNGRKDVATPESLK